MTNRFQTDPISAENRTKAIFNKFARLEDSNEACKTLYVTQQQSERETPP